ncbi:AmpG family muropeptide MFS transporter [Fodinicurvata halophila]|uniref:AmpG family muropeptide MFS transporter n=2 Tax=Fodinicurvata halophila TaxID=1419723 RepID=A0ABV8UPC0_9PROT
MTLLSRWTAAAAVYNDRRMLAILLMGFSSGLPLLLGFSTLSYWLSTAGIDRTTIGLFAAVSTPFALKFLWAPLIDHVKLPVMSRLFGRRRGWALSIQVLLAGSILLLGTSDPENAPFVMAAYALLVAFLSASQDIVIDAYRIEVLEENEQGAGAAVTQTGYRLGMIVAGAGALALSDFISWFWVYAAMGSLVLIGMIGVLIGPEPEVPKAATEPVGKAEDNRIERALAWLKRAVVDPFAEFLTRRGWFAILLFVLLYKYGDAIAATMTNPFFNEVGFSGVEIGSVTKFFGVFATLFGIFVGGMLVAKIGVLKALFIGGILQAVTNIFFAWLAVHGPDLWLLAVVVGVDNFTGGLGSAAFVAYLSSLCNVAFTGTQYALLTSLMAFGRTLMSTGSGWLVDQMGWVLFFMSTSLMAIPGLLLLIWISRLYPTGQLRPAPAE